MIIPPVLNIFKERLCALSISKLVICDGMTNLLYGIAKLFIPYPSKGCSKNALIDTLILLKREDNPESPPILWLLKILAIRSNEVSKTPVIAKNKTREIKNKITKQIK